MKLDLQAAFVGVLAGVALYLATGSQVLACIAAAVVSMATARWLP